MSVSSALSSTSARGMRSCSTRWEVRCRAFRTAQLPAHARGCRAAGTLASRNVHPSSCPAAAVTLLYSAGLPLLLPIAAIAIFITYWLDKLMFINWYRSPPRYEITLGAQMMEFVPFLVVAQLGFSMWMVTAPSIFPPTSLYGAAEIDFTAAHLQLPAYARLRQSAVVPLLLLVLAVIAGTIIRMFGMGFLAALNRLWLLVTNGKGYCCGREPASMRRIRSARHHAIMREFPPFSQAKADQKFTGLDSYSLLANPRFATAFGMSRAMSDTCVTAAAARRGALPPVVACLGRIH